MPTPISPSLWDIKLKADLTSQRGLFTSLASSPGRSRVWAQHVIGSNSWQDLPTDPDLRGNGPTMKFYTDVNGASDRFQVTVYFINAAPTDFASITISAAFTPYRHGNVTPMPLNATPMASPFIDANGNVQSLVTATWSGSDTSTIYLHPDTAPGEHAIVFMPGNFNFDAGLLSRGAKLQFEFTIIAQFTTAAGVTKQYAYDPEMEVDVCTSGEKPIPAEAAGAVGA